MERNGGSSGLYLARTPCVPSLFTWSKRSGNRRALRLPGRAGNTSIVQWSLRSESYSASTKASQKIWESNKAKAISDQGGQFPRMCSHPFDISWDECHGQKHHEDQECRKPLQVPLLKQDCSETTLWNPPFLARALVNCTERRDKQQGIRHDNLKSCHVNAADAPWKEGLVAFSCRFSCKAMGGPSFGFSKAPLNGCLLLEISLAFKAL